MRHLRTTWVALATAALAVTAMGQNITNSPHDLTTGSTDAGQNITGLTEICLPCHTPHFSDTSVAGAPLWNHQVTTQTFTMYTTLQSRTGTPDGPSKLCLSCHDGITAMDNYSGKTNGTQPMTNTTTVVGTDLTNDHPIGLSYPPPDATDYDTAANVKSAGLKLPVVGADERVECNTCHNPHDSTLGKFLRKSNASSALCLTCHKK